MVRSSRAIPTALPSMRCLPLRRRGIAVDATTNACLGPRLSRDRSGWRRCVDPTRTDNHPSSGSSVIRARIAALARDGGAGQGGTGTGCDGDPRLRRGRRWWTIAREIFTPNGRPSTRGREVCAAGQPPPVDTVYACPCEGEGWTAVWPTRRQAAPRCSHPPRHFPWRGAAKSTLAFARAGLPGRLPDRAKRTATVETRFGEVEICRPRDERDRSLPAPAEAGGKNRAAAPGGGTGNQRPR